MNNTLHRCDKLSTYCVNSLSNYKKSVGREEDEDMEGDEKDEEDE